MSFTLTMWDVKSLLLLLKPHLLPFYLNYVGCKENSVNSSGRCIIRFTLTMWDVKEELERLRRKFDSVLP